MDDRYLYEAIIAAEDVMFWIHRYIEEPNPEVLQLLQAAMEKFEESKP
jgi:myo-inositol catabolism protein IolC